MNSATDANLSKKETAVVEVKKRTAFDVSLILGIVAIGIFLGLFILEFSRILSFTGEVDHIPPTNKLSESAAVWHGQTSLRIR